MAWFKSKFEMWLSFHSSSEAIFGRASWFQDLPLLAAPCRWDHHLCTDLKEEGKIMDDAVRGTCSRQVGNMVVCIFVLGLEVFTFPLGTERERESKVYMSFSPSFLEWDDLLVFLVLGSWGRWCLLGDNQDRVFNFLWRMRWCDGMWQNASARITAFLASTMNSSL